VPGDATAVRLEQAVFAPLASLEDFHQAALQLAVPGRLQPGPPGIDLEPGLRVGRLCQIDLQSRASGDIVVGERTWVHRTARLAGPCVIGSDCYIDRGVQIHNSVVMPDSYIGEGLQVDNAIIAGSTLIRVDRGIQIRVSEPKLLSSNGSGITGLIRQWPERVIGAALLILSLPLWPLALLAATFASPRAVLTSRQILSNRCQTGSAETPHSVANAWQFATRIPLLRHLPMLWLVVSGDLQLFGARPLPAGHANRPTASTGHRDAAVAAGLLGPAALYLAADAPEEEIRLCELEFAANTRRSALLTRLGTAARLLFSPRTWWPAQTMTGAA
jgi:hypothetical protein